jgi:hypothetical protein
MSTANGLILMLQAATPVLPLRRITPRADCLPGQDEVVVCGRASDRYRIPPSVRSTGMEANGTGSGLSGTQILGGTGPCGIFAGQRRCSPTEAQEAGYGGGRDPLTFGTKILTRLTDPDAEIDSPPQLPAERKPPGR